MNRKDFLKTLGAGAIVATIAPKVLAEKPEVPAEEPKVTLEWGEPQVTDFSEQLQRLHPLGYFILPIEAVPDGMTIEELLFLWKEKGVCLHKGTYRPEFIPYGNPIPLDRIVL